MQNYLGVLTIILMMGMVIVRVRLMKREGIEAMQFGKLDKTDFLIPPFALFYFYTLFAAAFDWPMLIKHVFFHSELVAWIGVFFCLVGLIFLAWSIVSFGQSFRVGIDTEHPDKLITSGAFSVSRNPIYVAFAFILMGQFLIFPNWIPLVYMVAGVWLFHRQVLREEQYLKEYYGEEYTAYCSRVRRYL